MLLDGCRSSQADVISGVPQGTVLGITVLLLINLKLNIPQGHFMIYGILTEITASYHHYSEIYFYPFFLLEQCIGCERTKLCSHPFHWQYHLTLPEVKIGNHQSMTLPYQPIILL